MDGLSQLVHRLFLAQKFVAQLVADDCLAIAERIATLLEMSTETEQEQRTNEFERKMHDAILYLCNLASGLQAYRSMTGNFPDEKHEAVRCIEAVTALVAQRRKRMLKSEDGFWVGFIPVDYLADVFTDFQRAEIELKLHPRPGADVRLKTAMEQVIRRMIWEHEVPEEIRTSNGKLKTFDVLCPTTSEDFTNGPVKEAKTRLARLSGSPKISEFSSYRHWSGKDMPPAWSRPDHWPIHYTVNFLFAHVVDFPIGLDDALQASLESWKREIVGRKGSAGEKFVGRPSPREASAKEVNERIDTALRDEFPDLCRSFLERYHWENGADAAEVEEPVDRFDRLEEDPPFHEDDAVDWMFASREKKADAIEAQHWLASHWASDPERASLMSSTQWEEGDTFDVYLDTFRTKPRSAVGQ